MNGAFDLHWFRSLADLLRKEQVAAIHAHEFTANTYGTMLGKLVNVPVVATVHGKNYYWEQAKRRVAYRCVGRMSTMVAVSDDLRQFLVQRVGIVRKRVRVIYNGVDVSAPSDLVQRTRVRSELELGQWETIIGAVGSLYSVKGHVYLIHALPSILKEYPKTLLLIVGRGELENELKAEVVKLNLQDHVRFLGFRNDTHTLLSLMDIFVMPSLSEGLSMAILEAMAAGLPIVATNVGGNPEIVLDGETGFLVPPENSHILAARVVDLLQDRRRARDFGDSGKRRVAERFSLSMMVDAYQNCYESAIGA
jgi:glycosyltransferase involved in cell wall biosynthesis